MARVEAGCKYDVDMVRGTGGLDAMMCCDYRRTRAMAMGLVECLCRELNSWRPRSGRGGERYKSEWGRDGWRPSLHESNNSAILKIKCRKQKSRMPSRWTIAEVRGGVYKLFHLQDGGHV